MKVSVIIPTYKRPGLLLETLESCLNQTKLPEEILIGDDSPDQKTEQILQEVINTSEVPIRYFHHKPALKEAGNVDFLYHQVQGDKILHLHDDDPIFPICIEALSEPFTKYPEIVAAFGLQTLISASGVVLRRESEQLNQRYFRTPDREGLIDGHFAGVVSAFPNNGFMVDAKIAREVGYAGGKGGYAADFYFGFRLGLMRKPFFFVNRPTAKVRLTANSMSRGNFEADNAFQRTKIVLTELKESDLIPEIKQSIANHISAAIMIAARNGNNRLGWEWFFSEYHRPSIFTPGGLWRFIHLCLGKRTSKS